MTVVALTPGAYFGRLAFRPLEKMFCAIEMDIAPPRELKNIAIALPVGMSLESRTTWTAMNGTVLCQNGYQGCEAGDLLWTPEPAPKPERSSKSC